MTSPTPVYSAVWLVWATLYPAYRSFKAVNSRNVKQYVGRNCPSKLAILEFVAITITCDPFFLAAVQSQVLKEGVHDQNMYQLTWHDVEKKVVDPA